MELCGGQRFYREPFAPSISVRSATVWMEKVSQAVLRLAERVSGMKSTFFEQETVAKLR